MAHVRRRGAVDRAAIAQDRDLVPPAKWEAYRRMTGYILFTRTSESPNPKDR